jgi:hypothetical protein
MRLTSGGEPTAPTCLKKSSRWKSTAGQNRSRWRSQLRTEQEPFPGRRHLDRGREADADARWSPGAVEPGDFYVIQRDPRARRIYLDIKHLSADVGPLFFRQHRCCY